MDEVSGNGSQDVDFSKESNLSAVEFVPVVLGASANSPKRRAKNFVPVLIPGQRTHPQRSRPTSDSRHATKSLRSSTEGNDSSKLPHQSSDEVKNILRYELNAALDFYLSRDTPVYLEGLGIIFPEIHTEQKQTILGNKITLYSETFRTLVFEKCYELISLHREKFAGIVETKDLIQRIYPRLPIFISSKWDERAIRRSFRALVDSIKREVIETGYSKEIKSVGDILCLHNRQGETFSEWYAGADIFIKSNMRQLISSCRLGSFERPVLNNAWELLEAAFGPPIATAEIDVAKELADLGYDASLLPTDAAPKIPVAHFIVDTESAITRTATTGTDGKGTHLFCTNGLRFLGTSTSSQNAEMQFGNEIVFQTTSRARDGLLADSADASQILQTAMRPLTVAWMLLQSSRSKTIKPGAGLTVDVPLFPQARNASSSKSGGRGDINMIFAVPFHLIRGEQFTTLGAFSYVNIMGITEDEGALATSYSGDYLTTLLDHKNLTRGTPLSRPSILARTEVNHEYGRRSRKGQHPAHATEDSPRTASGERPADVPQIAAVS